MKKLIIAAAIVCAAAFAQAASYNWKAANVYDITGTSLYSGAATLFATTLAGAEVASFSGTLTDGAITQVISSDSFTVNTNYKFYYTMTDSKGNTFRSSTVMSKAQSTMTPTINFAANGTWTKAPEPEPTPEPTSAMLMLLGMAGLALKRKRA